MESWKHAVGWNELYKLVSVLTTSTTENTQGHWLRPEAHSAPADMSDLQQETGSALPSWAWVGSEGFEGNLLISVFEMNPFFVLEELSYLRNKSMDFNQAKFSH